MTSVALVFRTIGERTSELSLELAKKNIAPDELHVLEDCRPFSEAVRRMLEIDYGTDYVVAVDADCLIFEDMRPFLNANQTPYVDCWVHDRFRGRLHCGVHITRADVMQQMAAFAHPKADRAYVLRPESKMRKLALNSMRLRKSFKSFRILHDHFQWLRDVWAKYALRELRSRKPEQRAKLENALVQLQSSASAETSASVENSSSEGSDPSVELEVMRAALRWAKETVPEGTSGDELASVVAGLQDTAVTELQRLGVEELPPLTRDEVFAFEAKHRWPAPFTGPIFGLGLSRTGTRSLTTALHVLGIDTQHYPTDPDTFEALTSGRLDFPLLNAFDGITDIVVSPYFAQLDQLYPDAKFILTVREEEGWLRSCANHWKGRDAYEEPSTASRETHMKFRRFLRAATYGTYDFHRERFAWVRAKHTEDVLRHFEGRPDKLLVLDIAGGQGYKELCAFLERPLPPQAFPHKGGKLSEKLRAAPEASGKGD